MWHSRPKQLFGEDTAGAEPALPPRDNIHKSSLAALLPWVMPGYNRWLERLENYRIADHATALPDPALILVVDMYEHAHRMAFEPTAVKCSDALFSNMDWQIV